MQQQFQPFCRFKVARFRFLHCVALGALTLVIVTLLMSCESNESPSENDVFDIQEFEGRWLILNYWADWCAPCRKEISELNILGTHYPDTIAIVGVNFDRAKGLKLEEQIKSMGIEFTNLERDPADLLRLSRPASLPTTYIFNPEGELSFKLVGPQTEQSLIERIGL